MSFTIYWHILPSMLFIYLHIVIPDSVESGAIYTISILLVVCFSSSHPTVRVPCIFSIYKILMCCIFLRHPSSLSWLELWSVQCAYIVSSVWQIFIPQGIMPTLMIVQVELGRSRGSQISDQSLVMRPTATVTDRTLSPVPVVHQIDLELRDDNQHSISRALK